MLADLSIWHILLLVAIVTLLFGTKRIPEIGASIGKGIQSFKKGLQDATSTEDHAAPPPPPPQSLAQSQPPDPGAPKRLSQ
ncbi:MAG TPA: twin-arginine translocase TatA/TatE family subunit [Gemmatimonadales bacterium]|nr:twin-arginine translocase TatA/TatE family subunit [Gemmatimonadales bacterium]